MSEQHTTEQVLSDTLADDELAVVVGGTEGPGGLTDGTGAR